MADGTKKNGFECESNICFDCQRACGGCSWSELDPETELPRFEPVPGWTAVPVRRQFGSTKEGKRFVDTYSITACPLFLPDPPILKLQGELDKRYNTKAFYVLMSADGGYKKMKKEVG